LTSALGFAATAIARDTNPPMVDHDRSGVSAKEAPSSGAIVTPEDKASGFGKHDERAGRGIDDDTSTANGDMSVNPGSSSDDMSVNPGPSSDDMNVNPGPSGDDMNVNPGPSSDDMNVNPGRAERNDTSTASHERPADMGPGNLRGQ
jgi:hypothetical protein